MKTRKKLSQQTLDRLATLYEYADGDPPDGDDEMAIEIEPRPAVADCNQQRATESERLLGRLLRAHEGVPAGDG
jgi:hypothetical protein